jgi:hypothetical protein
MIRKHAAVAATMIQKIRPEVPRFGRGFFGVPGRWSRGEWRSG